MLGVVLNKDSRLRGVQDKKLYIQDQRILKYEHDGTMMLYLLYAKERPLESNFVVLRCKDGFYKLF